MKVPLGKARRPLASAGIRTVFFDEEGIAGLEAITKSRKGQIENASLKPDLPWLKDVLAAILVWKEMPVGPTGPAMSF